MSVIAQHLIAMYSVLPSDSSALDSSISALKSSISALEVSIKTLDGKSVFWETWLLPFSALVVIGVGLEVWALLWDHVEAMADWRRGIVLPPERPSTGKLLLGIVATFLVVIGVAGELGTSGKIASINGQLRTKNSDLRSASDQLLALVTQEAGDAATSAHNATGDAQDAKTVAGDAQVKAVNARREADSFEQDIVSAKTQATTAENDLAAALQRTARLEQQLSWRTVTPEQKKAIRTALLRTNFLPLRGWEIRFSIPMGCVECGEYADALKDALDGLGGTISGPDAAGYVRVPQGVALQVNPIYALGQLPTLLLNDLHANGVDIQGISNEKVPEHTIEVAIGVKPHATP
jgi:hypothetical protein